MALDLAGTLSGHFGSERKLKQSIHLRLIEPHEREKFDEMLGKELYLHNPTAVGAVLRYVVTGKDEWLALLVFCSPALHLKARDQWLQWKATEVGQRRHLIAQNSRFLIRVNAHAHPNLASCILGQVAQRIREDWQQAFGHPVLALETFIDPQRFRGTCYKAAGWQRLGRTRGCKRSSQDYYEDAQHPKELWMRALSRKELRVLRQPRLPEELLAPGAKPPPPPCPVPTRDLDSLWHHFRNQVRDYRDPHGLRHPLPALLTIIALAVSAGCHGPEAIGEFAQSLNHHQRRRVRCRPRPGKRRQYDVPSIDTLRRCLKHVDSMPLARSLIDWMKTHDPHAPAWVHFDGKVLKGAQPAPAADPKIIEAHVPAEIDPQQQKPKANKALTLVNFMTDDQWIPRRSAWRVRLVFCASRPPVNTCAKGWPGKQHTISVMPSAAFGNRKRLPKSCSKPCGAIGPLKIASITGATALRMRTAAGCETVDRLRTYRSSEHSRSSSLNNSVGKVKRRVPCPCTRSALCAGLRP